MNKVLIIAEAGVNHNGNMDLAKKLIDAAAAAQVDYVKFQTFKADKLVSKKAGLADYQKKNLESGVDSQIEMLRKLELDESMHHELIAHCNKRGVKFLSTAFDMDSIELLEKLEIDLYKIPSGELTNYPFLSRIGQKNKHTILSTGMATMGEIEAALEVLQEAGVSHDNITVLHCNTEYPTPMADVNLKAMNTIGQAFGVKIGYSDHTLGIEVPIAAVALGAVCIEKHFTLDRTMEGPDHKASLEPDELKAMVSAIRNIETALGNGIKQPSPSEKRNKEIARKSIHIAKDVKAGQVITWDDLIMKRPGSGISPMQAPDVLGKKIRTDLAADTLLNYSHFE